MIRGFALTGAAVTGRLWGLLLGSPSPEGNGLVAEWWIQSRGYTRTLPSAALSPSISSRSAQSSAFVA
jgi:hypothetical protein